MLREKINQLNSNYHLFAFKMTVKLCKCVIIHDILPQHLKLTAENIYYLCSHILLPHDNTWV